ncbi:MAG: histidine kinase [Streptosporangiaceae bacterium]|nr:histidine kinase [Streptosporangiaceae bacterium]
MRFRNSRLRTKVTALLLSLTALWAFAAWVTIREGMNLVWVSTLDSAVAGPSDPVLAALQQERRLTVVALARPGPQQLAAVGTQRVRTDKVRAVLVRRARGAAVQRAAGPPLRLRIREALGQLSGLDADRRAIDAGLVSRTKAAAAYTEVIESVFRIYDSMATLDDKELAKDTRTVIQLDRTWELLGQEDTLLAGALAGGNVNAAEHIDFIEIVGARRFDLARSTVELQHMDPVAYRQLTRSEKLTRLRDLEDQVIRRTRAGTRPPVNAQQWSAAAGPALADLRQTVQSAGNRLVKRAEPIAMGVIIRVVLACGLGLLAVIASIVVSVTTARALLRQLKKLRSAAWELADQRLPSVVERLGNGEEVDVAAEAPPLRFGADEIGQLGRAFNAVQETAIRVAVEQAELRRGIRDILLSLARRSQTLVRRQLSLLDVMERRELDPTELEDLFQIDHLATRMRRNAENLIVLSGATPARGWRRSVPMVDVIRAAIGEVEEYSRVNVLPVGRITLQGRAVGDVAHLLAELIENALSFSPAYTVVQIGGHMAARGYAIEIDDRGLGMSEESRAAANERIRNSAEFNLSSTARLGLYVVSRLADRYGIRVSLKRSPYGGTTAVVLIPLELVVEDGTAPDVSVGAAGTVPGSGAMARPEPSKASSGRPVPGRVTALPAAAEPGSDPQPVVADGAETATTPSGLPVRVPQASLAPALKGDGPPSRSQADGADECGRSPEEIRELMASYQSGTRRGRAAAARSGPAGARAEVPEAPAGSAPQAGPDENL